MGFNKCQYCQQGELFFVNGHYQCLNCGQVNIGCCSGDCNITEERFYVDKWEASEDEMDNIRQYINKNKS